MCSSGFLKINVGFPPGLTWADGTARGKFSAFEQSLLKWFDINHLLRIKFLMLDVCAVHERDLVVADWLELAERYATQTEIISQLGCFRYMQDTSATHLSSFGVVGHKVRAGMGKVLKADVRRLATAAAPACHWLHPQVNDMLRQQFARLW